MNKSNTQNFIRQLSIDCVIFGYQECQLKVLLPKMNLNGNFWALPSGYINQEEGIDQAARRIQTRAAQRDRRVLSGTSPTRRGGDRRGRRAPGRDRNLG